GTVGRPFHNTVPFQNDVSPPRQDPLIDRVEANHHAQDDPPRFSRAGRVFFGDVFFAVRAPLRFVANRALAMGARHHQVIVFIDRLIVVILIVIAVPIVVPLFLFGNSAPHATPPRDSPGALESLRRRAGPPLSGRRPTLAPGPAALPPGGPA